MVIKTKTKFRLKCRLFLINYSSLQKSPHSDVFRGRDTIRETAAFAFKQWLKCVRCAFESESGQPSHKHCPPVSCRQTLRSSDMNGGEKSDLQETQQLSPVGRSETRKCFTLSAFNHSHRTLDLIILIFFSRVIFLFKLQKL